MSVSRREFLARTSKLALCCGLQPVGLSNAASRNRGRLQLGLTSPVYFNGFSPFLNWWKTASPPTLTLSSGEVLSGQAIWDRGGYLVPATGEIISPAPADLVSVSRIFYKSANRMQVSAGCNYAREEWTAIWDGIGSGQIQFLNTGGQQRFVRSNQIDFTTGTDPDRISLVLKITDRNDPPRNVAVFQRRYRASISGGEKFNPDWLAEVRRFGVLRFMGWMPTNNETITDFSQLADEAYFAWCQPFISTMQNGEFGPKGSIHPQLICELANETGCNIHVCIPVRATDGFVKKFAEYFRDHTEVEITYELSNECWNPIFDQFHYCRAEGEKLWPGDFWAFAKWYGYRSAQCMDIIRDVYGHRNRWRGALATQTVDVNKTLNALSGVNYWRRHVLKPARSLRVSDLFKSLYVTGYFGFGVFGKKITAITNSAPGVCTAKDHEFKNGQRIKLFVTDGPVQLNGEYFTVANCTKNSFELEGISTIGMGAYLPSCRLGTSVLLPQFPTYNSGGNGKVASLSATEPGQLMIDEIEVLEGDKVLVKDQPHAEQNGIYQLVRNGRTTGWWRLDRVSYFSSANTMKAGSSVLVEQGNARGTYVLAASINAVGRDALTFESVNPNNYSVVATLFELMDASTEMHARELASFPAKYTYFNQQVARAMREGACDMPLTVPESVAGLESTYWPPQLSIAQAYGLTFRQYEGGCGLAGAGIGLLGDPYAVIYGGNERFGEFIFQFGHSAEVAGVYADAYEAFLRIGGEYPAKFVADGRSSNAGTWAGVRFWPLKANGNVGDAGNPVWRAVLAANA